MDLLSQIVARAQSNKQRIVLPEAEEERTLCAADKALADGLADIILIGNPAKVEALAKEKGLQNIGKATLIDPENYDKSEELAEKLAEIRKSKGMTIEEARKLIKNPLYLGCMIIKTEGADGQISGALSTTGDTLRPALQIIKCQPGITCVSGGPMPISWLRLLSAPLRWQRPLLVSRIPAWLCSASRRRALPSMRFATRSSRLPSWPRRWLLS